MKYKIFSLLWPFFYLLSACGSVKPVVEPTVFPTPAGGGNGTIAYTFTNGTNNMEIRLINLDGSADRSFTDLQVSVNHSDWSPDGQKLVLVKYMDRTFTTWSIHVFNADGSNLVRLTDTTGAADSEPAWSPDNGRILFSRVYFTTNNQYDSSLWLMNADGSDLHMVVADGFAGKWSPDGTRIIYSSDKTGNQEIYTSNPDGTDEIQITYTDTDESYPSWSPDGTQIAFIISSGLWNSDASVLTFEIYVMNADGSDWRQLTDNDALDGNPRWSPDGSQLLFASDRADAGHFDIYVMNADGTNVRQVTHTPAGTTAINPIWVP